MTVPGDRARLTLSVAPVAARAPVPILLVDDDPAKRLALKAALAPLGHTIVEADSGLAALRCVMAQDFAVILLDVRMPIMDGFETAALIRQRWQSEPTPIILVTAYGKDEIINNDLYRQGAVDFIFGRIVPAELRAKVSIYAGLFARAEELAARARDVQANADQLRLLADAAPIGIFQTDAENRYVYTNPGWTEITGIGADEAAGRAWDTIIDSRERAVLAADLRDGAVDPAQLRRRFEIRVPGRASRIALVTATSVAAADGAISGWIGTLADVTAEAGAEAAMADARDEATEASRLKSHFLANMSHEIRTPMNGVIGMADLLLETDLDPRQRDFAQTVRVSGEALLTIINDILDFSKVEAGKLEVERIQFDLRTVVADVVDLLTTAAEAKGLGLAAFVVSSVPSVVNGDPGRVRQVLINLVANAIKFTQAGEVAVRVTQAQEQALGADAVVRFDVSDTGDGIAQGKLAEIFEPFVQADTSTSRKYGGTGLGLAISGHLVALMGGDCGVTSELGTGSTFWFTIRVHADAEQGADAVRAPDERPAGAGEGPAGVARFAPSGLCTPATNSAHPSRRTDAAAVAVGAPAGAPSGEPGDGPRLLLAEDNLTNRKVAATILSNAGYRVDMVFNGAEAVQAAAAQSYDAILMDCQMPEMNGYDATATIRAEEGSGRRTPIIAVTAGARREDREQCLAAGMDSHLTKPLNKDALLALVASAVSNEQAKTAAPAEGERSSPAELVIDHAVIDELRLLGEDFLAELVDRFEQDTDLVLVELGEAFERGDAAGARRIAHGIKGSCGELGGQRLAASCDRLETNASAGGVLRASGDLQELQLEYRELLGALKQPRAPAALPTAPA